MSTLKDVYKKYFQKSKIFLYPALGIKRGKSESLIETYLGIRGKISPEDNKLIAVFYYRTDPDFKMFEQKYLLTNPLFEAFYILDDNKVAYVFDFSNDTLKSTYQAVVNGKYTKIDVKHKGTLLGFYEDEKILLKYVDSFLFPSFYYDQYADLLAVDKRDIDSLSKLLEKVTELCSPPDMDKEILVLIDENQDIIKKDISLSINQQS